MAIDASDEIAWLDERARRLLAAAPGAPFSSIAAPGGAEGCAALLARARALPPDTCTDAPLELLVRAGGAPAVLRAVAQTTADGVVHVFGALLPTPLGDVVAALGEAHRGIESLHEELADKSDLLRRTSDVKSRVVANVSHEFRTPLHTILGLSKLLLDGLDGPLTEEQEKQIRYIRTSAEELAELVDDLLDLSRAESGKMALHADRFALTDLFRALRGMLRPLEKADGVRLVIEEPPEAIMESDRGKVCQVLRALVSNALKFTEQGAVHVAAEVSGARARFVVRDTGIGIAPAHHEQIFEEFGQVENALHQKVKGSGLGLALARRLADVLGGTLAVESELGRGAAFTLDVPLVHAEVRELRSIASRPIDPTMAPVLVVEDDRKTIFVYEKYLSMSGFQVIPARTIDEARRLMQTVRPAAMVLDVMLEGETSWQFLSELKGDPATQDLPVLVVTVTAHEQKARALGADEFWLKPVSQERLLKKLRAIAKPGAPARLLVIDDDERSRYILAKMIGEGPFVFDEAADGATGMSLARERRPHLILLDFLLEDMTAFDVLDGLKADPRTRGIPVIIVTAQALAPEQRARLATHAESILSKESLTREIAIQRIRDALRNAGVGAQPHEAARVASPADETERGTT